DRWAGEPRSSTRPSRRGGERLGRLAHGWSVAPWRRTRRTIAREVGLPGGGGSAREAGGGGLSAGGGVEDALEGLLEGRQLGLDVDTSGGPVVVLELLPGRLRLGVVRHPRLMVGHVGIGEHR